MRERAAEPARDREPFLRCHDAVRRIMTGLVEQVDRRDQLASEHECKFRTDPHPSDAIVAWSGKTSAMSSMELATKLRFWPCRMSNQASRWIGLVPETGYSVGWLL